jgi:hypothetical protein
MFMCMKSKGRFLEMFVKLGNKQQQKVNYNYEIYEAWKYVKLWLLASVLQSSQYRMVCIHADKQP